MRAFANDEDGGTAVEYALLAAMFAIAVLGAFMLMRAAIQGIWTTDASQIGGATAS